MILNILQIQKSGTTTQVNVSNIGNRYRRTTEKAKGKNIALNICSVLSETIEKIL